MVGPLSQESLKFEPVLEQLEHYEPIYNLTLLISLLVFFHSVGLPVFWDAQVINLPTSAIAVRWLLEAQLQVLYI